MVEQISAIRVFLASPNDLDPEVEIVETLIEELNRTWCFSLGIVLRLIRSGRDVRPGISTDTQAVVNAQISDDYDVFIGILWGRMGTPTPRFSSGTHEEFERAISRWSGTGSPEIMIYFKDAPIRPSKQDTHQVELVQAFRRSLNERGVLHTTFDEERGFQNSLRAHLSSLAQKFSRDTGVPSNGFGNPATRQVQTIGYDEDFGFFDYLEIYNRRMADMSASLDKITAATARIGEQMSASASEMTAQSQTGNPVAVVRFIARSAADLTDYSEVVRIQTAEFSSSSNHALESLTKAMSLYSDFENTDEGQLADLEDSLTRMLVSARDARENMYGMRTMIDSFPKLTTEMNRAKRLVCGELDALVGSIDNTLRTTSNIVESIQSMRGRRHGLSEG